METSVALSALAALSQESRLAVFRLLVQNGPDGLTPGIIGTQLDLPPPTLSFHLRSLAQAGLVTAVQEGRFLRYRADMTSFNSLIAFLTEDCCRGKLHLCLPSGENQ